MGKRKFCIEICANSVLSCIEAQKGGADRVELCAGIPEGGTTPSFGMINMAREKISIGLNVIIRPRGGDFLYTDEEVEEMIQDICMARESGADGLVFGALTPDGDVDMDVMGKLMVAAGDLPVTFHRAFDHARDPFDALDKIRRLGCRRILTSGQAPTAADGIPLLSSLVKAAGDDVIIMPGCGVNLGNILQICEMTGAREFHMSVREKVSSRMVYRNPSASMGKGSDDYNVEVTSADKVSGVVLAMEAYMLQKEMREKMKANLQ